MSTGQDGEQVVFAPGGARALGFDTDFGRLFLTEQLESQTPHLAVGQVWRSTAKFSAA
jgi:hypothetical protein